jgi:hypothetical protein
MVTAEQDQYPHDLAGAATTPPEPAPADLVEAWRQYEAEEAAELEDGPLVAAAGDWRMAGSLQQLLQEADAVNPARDKRSDGGVGNARHQSLGKASDHNPWVKVGRTGVVRARDFDVDGLDVAGAFERMRAAAAAGRLPQLVPGGYLIYAGRITAPDFRSWREYRGENPHVTHGHVSVALSPDRFDDRRAWNVWAAPAPTTPRPAPTTPRPAPPAPTRDLRGRGLQLRGDEGNAGGRVRELQRFLLRVYPAYAREGLGSAGADGVWGPRTSAVLREFAHRRPGAVPSADGRNVGPQLARKLTAAGFRG